MFLPHSKGRRRQWELGHADAVGSRIRQPNRLVLDKVERIGRQGFAPRDSFCVTCESFRYASDASVLTRLASLKHKRSGPSI